MEKCSAVIYPASSRLYLGIEKFGEAWIGGHVREIGIRACLDSIARVLPNGFGEVFEAALGVSGDTGQHGEAIEGVVGSAVLLEDGFEFVASVLKVAIVEQ